MFVERLYKNKGDSSLAFSPRKERDAMTVQGISTSVALAGQVMTWSLEGVAKANHLTFPANSLQHALTYNSGDLMNGWEDAFFASLALSYLAKNMSYKKRLIVGSLFSVGTLLLAELPQLSGMRPDAINGFTVFGKADVADIPAGALGIALFAGSTWLSGELLHSKRRFS